MTMKPRQQLSDISMGGTLYSIYIFTFLNTHDYIVAVSDRKLLRIANVPNIASSNLTVSVP